MFPCYGLYTNYNRTVIKIPVVKGLIIIHILAYKDSVFLSCFTCCNGDDYYILVIVHCDIDH